MFVVLSVAFFYREFSYSRAVLILIYLNSIILILFWRWIIFKIEQYLYNRGRELKNVLIIGSNLNSQKIYSDIKNSKQPGLKVIGYCSKDKINSAENNYLGDIDNIRNIIEIENIEVIIAILTVNDHSKLLDIIHQCEGLNVEFMFMPDIIELMNSKVRIKSISGIPFLTLKDIPINLWNRILKRTFDIIFSLMFLIITLPISIILTILIKIESKGPLFYLQERVGLEGKIFKLIKFRSMRLDAEDRSGPVWAKNDDNRTTKIGGFIRRFSLDEIPQFINVLKGDMSVVGPRPERPFFVEQFKERIPKYLERHCVKSGITGWAQVNGLRGNTPLDERIRYDIYYIENWSLLLDIFIIFRTIKEIFFAENAY
jgi:exopolysaccharide biosynthesis polyprenyl glycosylphosphotransferase